MEYISLGSTCSIAWQKQKYNIKKETFPFDWLRVDSLDHINQALADRFTNFFSFTQIGESTKFTLFEDDFIESSGKCMIMKNQYGMKFYHDFTDNNLEQVKAKYTRRIERFYNLINSNQPICFIRDELKKIDMEEVNRFIYLIKQINPQCQFTLIIILHKPKINLTENNNTKIIIDNKEFQHWTRPNVQWQQIFNL